MPSLIAIVITITQLLMKLLEGPLADVAGKFKILIVTGLSLVLAVATGVATGMSLLESLLAGGGLAALQVFIHQIYVQFFQKSA